MSLPVQENTGAKVSLGKLFMVSGAAVICIGILVQGMLKDGVTSWVPTLIKEKYNVSASFSVLLSAVLPIINLSGAWFSTKLYEGPFKLNETAAAAFCFALTLIPLTGIVFVGKYPIAICVILLALFTTIIAAMNHLLMTLIPVHFAKFGRASTVRACRPCLRTGAASRSRGNRHCGCCGRRWHGKRNCRLIGTNTDCPRHRAERFG